MEPFRAKRPAKKPGIQNPAPATARGFFSPLLIDEDTDMKLLNALFDQIAAMFGLARTRTHAERRGVPSSWAMQPIPLRARSRRR
jgi:hypothetical protein